MKHGRKIALSPLVLAAALLLCAPALAVDPQFAAPAVNPFGLVTQNNRPASELADVDGDGDFDLVTGEAFGAIRLSRNTGSASAPAFGAVTTIVPTSPVVAKRRTAPTMIDLDGDGDLDIFAGTRDGIGISFQNSGNPTNPLFSRTYLSSLGVIVFSDNDVVPQYSTASTCDLDGDGQLELICGTRFGHMHWFESVQSGPLLTFPVSSSMVNPFGIQDHGHSANYALAEAVDIDGDGDEDVFTLGSPSALFFQRNVGNPASPVFAPVISNPFGFNPSGTTTFFGASFVDLDDDSDIDVLATDDLGRFLYYQNSAPVDTNPPAINIGLGSLVTREDVVTFDVFFSEDVGNSFTTSDLTVVGSLAAAQVDLVQKSPTEFVVFLELDDPNAGGTVGIEVTGQVKDLAGNIMPPPIGTDYYTIDHFPPGDVSKNGTFDLADVALLADANLGLATLP